MSALFNSTDLVVPFEKLRMTDVEEVGGKNASLGEMISHLPSGVKVPTGFATTAHAFRDFLAYGGLGAKINARLSSLDTEDVRTLAQVGAEIRAERQPGKSAFTPVVERHGQSRKAEIRRRAGVDRASGGVEFADFPIAGRDEHPPGAVIGRHHVLRRAVGASEYHRWR